MRTVAYLGPEGTNTHLAAKARFGRRATYLHAPTVDDVFHLVERRKADYGVVPIENSLEGAVTHTLDRFVDFVDTPVTIHGEVEQPIRHALIFPRGAVLSNIRAVYSHPQALAQCRSWLARHLPDANRRETNSTADAIGYVLHDQHAWTRAAIGRRELARGHDLRALNIPEERDNTTRFLMLGLGEPRPGRRNKTSLLFGVQDRPGALHDALLAFKQSRINMTKIESRPSKRKAWEYVFFVDLEGHESEPRVTRALGRLAHATSLLRILGSYPMSSRHGRD
jgi:chorismate mutase/prephenate dehydratase